MNLLAVRAGTLMEGQDAGQPLDGGLRAIDVGPLERTRYLEGLGFLHMMVQQPPGTGFASVVKVISCWVE